MLKKLIRKITFASNLSNKSPIDGIDSVLKLVKHPKDKVIIKKDLINKNNEINYVSQIKNIIEGFKYDRKKAIKKEPISENILTESGQKHTKYVLNKFYNISNLFEEEDPIKTNHMRQKIDLFGAKPLNIFLKMSGERKAENSDVYNVWDELHQKELNNIIRQEPINAYEETMRKTEEGVLWKFPIDNEIDVGEEKNVSFQDHVFIHDYFLEHLQHLNSNHIMHLPNLKHFMELVCVGLGRNPHYTVQEKRQIVLWYVQYFESKKDIIQASLDIQESDTQQASAVI